MVNYARIQHKIDKGLGIAGKHLGPPYNVYRPDSTASGDFPNGWDLVGTGVPVFIRRTTDAKIQNALLASGTMWFDVIGNVEPYLIGDVFLLEDPAYSPGISYGTGATALPGTQRFTAFTLAWHAPVDEPVGARCDTRGQIFRPQGPPDTSFADGSSQWRGGTYAAQPLVLQNGVYSFLSAFEGRDASFVPVGVSSTDRPPRGRLIPPPIPGDMQIPRYFMYVPPLPGYTPAEGDRVVTEQGARYLVTNPYYQQTGVVGNQMGVDRMVAED